MMAYALPYRQAWATNARRNVKDVYKLEGSYLSKWYRSWVLAVSTLPSSLCSTTSKGRIAIDWLIRLMARHTAGSEIIVSGETEAPDLACGANSDVSHPSGLARLEVGLFGDAARNRGGMSMPSIRAIRAISGHYGGLGVTLDNKDRVSVAEVAGELFIGKQ